MTAIPTMRILVASTTLICVSVLVGLGCGKRARAEIVAGLDVCHECQMVIDQPRHAAGYLEDGEFVTFDAPICVLRHYESLEKRGVRLPVSIHFAVNASGEMQPSETTAFLLTHALPTVMNGGALAFADAAAAEAARTAEDEKIVDWPGFRLARGKPDRVIEVLFGPEGMSPEVVNAARGELVQWSARSSGLASDLVLSVKGYPELAPIRLPASGEAVAFRMRTLRPGAGFPIVATGVDAPLGMLKVSGAHTADEEAL